MKILALIFSKRGKNSITAQLAAQYVDCLRTKYDGNIEYECITADQMNIDYCLGCESCFYGKPCPLAEKDDLMKLRKKIEECDFFIMGSPVYMASISGICKSFLDRSADWSHHMPLIGKPCVQIATVDHKNQQQLALFLMNFFTEQCGGLTFAQLFKDDTQTEEEIASNLNMAADNTIKALSDPLSVPHSHQTTYYRSVIMAYKSLLQWREANPEAVRTVAMDYEEKLLPYESFDAACKALFNY